MRMMLPKAHFEYRKGTADQARNYCTPNKNGDEVDPTYRDGPWEHGTYVQPTGVNDILLDIVERVKAGET